MQISFNGTLEELSVNPTVGGIHHVVRGKCVLLALHQAL
jgi:hypothetical protein